MDWLSIITAIGGSSALAGVFSWLSNRRMNDAQANNSDADYAEKIIKQADERVAQYKADADAARADREELRRERDKWMEESRGQRKAKQEWRGRYEEAVARVHKLELSIKDMDAKMAESEWHRCEVMACRKRKPPRDESQKTCDEQGIEE